MTPCHQVAKDDGGGHGSSEPDHHTALGCKWNRVERYGALSHAQPSLRGLRSSQPCTLRPESSRRSSERAIGSYFKGCVGWKCCRGNFRPSACLQASARFYGSHHPDLTTSLDFPPCRVWHTSAEHPQPSDMLPAALLAIKPASVLTKNIDLPVGLIGPSELLPAASM